MSHNYYSVPFTRPFNVENYIATRNCWPGCTPAGTTSSATCPDGVVIRIFCPEDIRVSVHVRLKVGACEITVMIHTKENTIVKLVNMNSLQAGSQADTEDKQTN